MIDTIPSTTTVTFDTGTFAGVSTGMHTAERPTEEVVAIHTATKRDSVLNREHAVQSLVTGIPLLLVDLAMTTMSLLGVSYLIAFLQGRDIYSGTWLQLPALLMFQVGLLWLHRVYPGAGISHVEELRSTARSTVLSIIFLCAINLLFGQLPRIEFATFVLTGITMLVTLPLARFAIRGRLAKTNWWGIRMLLIGEQADCREIRRRSEAYRTAGLVVSSSLFVSRSKTATVESELSPLTNEALRVACDHRSPMVALTSTSVQHLATRLMFKFPSVVWIEQPSSSDLNTEASELLGMLSTRTSSPLMRGTTRVVKRCLDLAITIPTLIVLAIPMGLIALAIKSRSQGPVLFGPTRIGQHGKEFRSWKFRTMVPNAEQVLKEKLESDPAARAEWERDVKLRNDPRIIPGIGHLLRNWSLDELPQLWNVLVGEMSLIGPRPIAMYEIERYQRHYYDYTLMLPGITGLWQVSGRNNTTYQSRVQMVHRYATNWSIWLDVWILVKTPIVVLTKRGAC